VALLGLIGLGLSAGRASWLLGLGAALAALWWLRRARVRAGQGASPARLRILERARLQDGAGLHLVEVEGLRLLVGTGQGGPRLLARLGSDRTQAAREVDP
jgi:flagellar biogenesis protein FliO